MQLTGAEMTRRANDWTEGDEWHAERATIMLGGRYLSLRNEGGGGMSTVWRAHDERDGRFVAVKMLTIPHGPDDRAVDSLALERQLRARLVHEAEVTATLDHPAVVRVLDVSGLCEEPPFFVMQYVEGWHLSATRGIPVVDAVRFVLPVAAALSQAHARGIIHRDVKRENIRVRLHGDDRNTRDVASLTA